MGRLIDATELKTKAFGKRGGLIHTSEVNKMPTVDAVPVVRCRECIWWHDMCGCACMTFHACDHSPDTFFCAWGEKKDV